MAPRLHLYGLAWSAAGLLWVVLGTRALVRHAQSRGGCAWPPVAALLVACVLAALFGARLHFLVLSPALLDEGLWVVVAPLGAEGAGLRIAGGLLAALTLLVLLGPRATRGVLPRAPVLDAVVPLAGPAIALGRLGCLADGCCFGSPCTAPWCVRFPFASPTYWSHVAQGLIAEGSATSLPVHPLQAYLGAAGLAAWLVSRFVARRGAPPGLPALVFVAILAGGRAAVEPLREASFGGVPGATELSAAIALPALALLVARIRSARRVQRAAELRSVSS